MSELKNQNFRLRIPPPKNDGAPIAIGEVQEVELILFSEFDRTKWLHFKYPAVPDFEPLELSTVPSDCFIAEITSEHALTAPTGNVTAQLKLWITDARFETGVAEVSATATIYNFKDAIK